MKHRIVVLLSVALLVSGCAQYASVSEKRPRFKPVRATAGVLATAHGEIASALRREKSDPLAALGDLLAAASAAAGQLALNPDDVVARDAYNFAVARIFGVIKEAKLDPWTTGMSVPAAEGEFTLTHRPDSRRAWHPALYDFTPADQLDFEGAYVTQRTTRAGVGAPLVAVGREVNQEADEEFSPRRIYYGVTAVIHFEGRRAVVVLEDPMDTERVDIGGKSFPLAADFTAAIAVMLTNTDHKRQELARLFRPEKYADTAAIARLQPYDPDKTVVLVIHGLKDTAATWTPLLNILSGDAAIRSNYQFWFYTYPTGYPYPYSAAILRRELDELKTRFPLQKQMVVVGHSMGGCISRLLITDTEEKLWMALFKKPPADVKLSPESRAFFTDAFIFEHRPEVGRVIFMAAPLGGSELASGWPGRVGSKLVRAPSALLAHGSDALKFVTFHGDELRVSHIPNSVDTLAPNNRFVRAVQTLPITPGIPYHVISGDRGKGGNKDHTEPVMSDGFVPYWSSHMDGAASELIVPSGHSVHQNAEAIAEVRRLLLEDIER